MGLASGSCGRDAAGEKNNQCAGIKADCVIALAGNPNTGKSTVFNALTGLNQHTGNWPGKTVLRAEGRYFYQGKIYKLIDLPGAYSLLANSAEEQVAGDYLCFGRPDATVVVVDATCLERNLNLVLQVLEITPRVVVCVNLLDEARRKNIRVNIKALEERLGVPVVGTAAREREGLDALMAAVAGIAGGEIETKPYLVRYNAAVEAAIQRIEPGVKRLAGHEFNSRWLALRLLDRDQTVIKALEQRQARYSGSRTIIKGEVLA